LQGTAFADGTSSAKVFLICRTLAGLVRQAEGGVDKAWPMVG
jgi:hypothetical protein